MVKFYLLPSTRRHPKNFRIIKLHTLFDFRYQFVEFSIVLAYFSSKPILNNRSKYATSGVVVGTLATRDRFFRRQVGKYTP